MNKASYAVCKISPDDFWQSFLDGLQTSGTQRWPDYFVMEYWEDRVQVNLVTDRGSICAAYFWMNKNNQIIWRDRPHVLDNWFEQTMAFSAFNLVQSGVKNRITIRRDRNTVTHDFTQAFANYSDYRLYRLNQTTWFGKWRLAKYFDNTKALPWFKILDTKISKRLVKLRNF